VVLPFCFRETGVVNDYLGQVHLDPLHERAQEGLLLHDGAFAIVSIIRDLVEKDRREWKNGKKKREVEHVSKEETSGK
jgi:hypothetical protein